MELTVELVRQRYREKAGFRLNRPEGANCYILLHFLTPVALTYGEKTVAAPCGSLIVFSPGFPHGFVSEAPLVHDWMHLSGDVEALMAEYGLQPNTLYQPEIEAAISEITVLLETEFFSRRPFWGQLAEVKVRELFIRTAQALSEKPLRDMVSAENAEALRRVHAKMLSALELRWSVEDIAAEMNLSPSRLHTIYKATFGISPRHDLILMRVEKAKALLWSNTSVTETAAQLGYSSVYHFIRQFRKATGVTPKQYIRKR